MNPEFNEEMKKVMEHIKQRNSGDGTHIFDAEKINAQLELINQIEAGVYNKAIEDAINVVRREPIGFAEFDFTVESILKSIQEKLTILKKIDKP